MATGQRGLWESVYYAILHSKTLTVTTSTYLPAERIHIHKILGAFLEAAGMAELKNHLAYCVHELAGNAKKANMKRLYFREKNLRHPGFCGLRQGHGRVQGGDDAPDIPLSGRA